MVVGLAPVVATAGPASAPAPTVEEASDADTLSEAEALERAKRSGTNVEIASLRGESSEVYATPDGKLEAREHLRPVRARVGGEWKPIDTGLAKRADGTVAPRAATVRLEFSGGGDEPLVRMERAGRELALSWPTKLPAPELDGDTATYRNVLPDVDLRMGAQEDGFTQLLVVKSAGAAASPELTELRLKLSAQGMNVRETASGGLEAVDEGAGSTVFEAPKPVMWDSSPGKSAASAAKAAGTAGNSAVAGFRDGAGKEGEPGAGESGKLAPVGVELPAKGNELVLKPDAGVLKGSNTQYPVFIDPQWYSPKTSAWTMVSKYWASSPQWKFNGESTAGVGYCGWAYCQPYDTKRVFYRIPVSKFAGRDILSAEFVVRNTWSASCSARGVQLWRTRGISSSTTWNSQDNSDFWIDHLKTESFAYGYDGCSAKDAEFDVRSAVQQAANGKWSTMTFGLQASSETDAYGWKRFSDDAFLRVKYNRPPAQLKMSQLTMEYGGTCKKSSSPARVRTLGKIYANNVTDPDGDTVAVQFQAKWDSGDGKGLITRWKPPLTSYKKSGSDFSITMPSVTENKTVHWYARSHDGGQYSPWSYTGDPTGCYFVYDTKVPRAPTIVSGEYPASNPDNPEDPWFDGVGKYGFFDIKAADTDVVKYWFGINGDPTSKNTLTTTSGALKTADVLPTKPGLNFVTAQAFDSAGNGSEIRTYQFRVKAGQPDRATWQLDEAAGAAQAAGSTPPRTAVLNGGVTAGGTGAKGTALEFNGTDGYAATDIPVVDTSGGFAVSAWAKLSQMPTGAAIIATQPGNHSPGFELYYSKHYDRWVFNQYASDTADASIVRAMAPQPGGVTAGTWTHLVGTYSASDDILQLYVNGQLAGQTAYSTPWEARRGLQIGAGSYSGAPASFFPGAIDELQLFDKPLTAGEVTKLRNHEAVGDPGRPATAIFPLDEPVGSTEITGRGGVLPAKYNGGVTTGVPGIAGKAARFNGTTGHAKIGQSSGAHINTYRSFTVSAWAKLDNKPDHAAIIAAQAGEHSPGFELYYSAAYDRWAFNQYSADSPTAVPVRALQPTGTVARAGEWVHLVGVHDTVADTLTLYVNGAYAGSSTLEGSFYAGQSMYIGAGSYSGALDSYFPGTIDDVRLLSRPVSADEVRQMFRQRPLVKGRWLLDEATTGTPATSPDASAEDRALTLGGGAKTGFGWVDDGALELDGVDDYAATTASTIDTGASFTVMGWAQSAGVPADSAAVLSAPGASNSAFAIRYVPAAAGDAGAGRWQISMPDSDAAATVVRVENQQFYDARDWNHLALVYDGFTKEAQLYVNGQLEEVACADADGDGESDDTTCADRLSWAENVLSYKATGGLQIGRARTAGAWGEYWPGAVDDVWVFQGALSESQIAHLSLGMPGVATEVPGTD
ncbi:LamG-like jellyroll fold domain-containing protein [Streptomyces sp. GC420]|uniref:LamG-like jellyroll fold domain-containing protein n=1 Tax=Streptomyces sp. GC420 TaxID=2697568 RepID=UPI0014150E49|nr:DNRLRE domain-containing protein [Streptomyces sp. GC420]